MYMSDAPLVQGTGANLGRMAELVYAHASGACDRKVVRVQVPLRPQLLSLISSRGRSMPCGRALRKKTRESCLTRSVILPCHPIVLDDFPGDAVRAGSERIPVAFYGLLPTEQPCQMPLRPTYIAFWGEYNK